MWKCNTWLSGHKNYSNLLYLLQSFQQKKVEEKWTPRTQNTSCCVETVFQQRISFVFFHGNSLNFTTPACFADILVNTFPISANYFLFESLWFWYAGSVIKILQNVIFGLFQVKNRPKSEKWNILILWKWILFLEKKYEWKIWNGQS